jgi:hypothetical protein
MGCRPGGQAPRHVPLPRGAWFAAIGAVAPFPLVGLQRAPVGDRTLGRAARVPKRAFPAQRGRRLLGLTFHSLQGQILCARHRPEKEPRTPTGWGSPARTSPLINATVDYQSIV